MKLHQAWSIASALGMLALCTGCGAENGASDPSASDDATASQDLGLRHRRHLPVPSTGSISTGGTAATGGTASTGGTAATPTPSAPTPNTTADVSSVIASAQNADGLAIPQPAGPGGQCPPVVVALGFWACPTLGETCSFSNSTLHDCTCDRTQGEGQTPSWVCN